jgi:hypothetical protein
MSLTSRRTGNGKEVKRLKGGRIDLQLDILVRRRLVVDRTLPVRDPERDRRAGTCQTYQAGRVMTDSF